MKEVKVFEYSFYDTDRKLRKGYIVAKGIREAKAYLREKYKITSLQKQQLRVGNPSDVEIA